MPFLRDKILSVMPVAWRDAAIAESKQWSTECMRCEYQSNVWDLGGVRWKSAGQPISSFPCPGCGKTTLHKIRKAMVTPQA